MVLNTILKTPLFRNLPDEIIQEVMSAGVEKFFEKDTLLFLQSDPATHFYLIVEGQVRLVDYTPDGDKIVIRYMKKGEIIGIIAVFNHSVYPATAEVAEPSRLFCWEGKAFLRLIESHPGIALNIIRALTGRIHELLMRIEDLSTKHVEDRIAGLLIRLMEKDEMFDHPIRFRFTREEIAQMTGTTLYTVSRVLKNWEKKGIVQSSRGQITILVPEKLKGIVKGSYTYE